MVECTDNSSLKFHKLISHKILSNNILEQDINQYPDPSLYKRVIVIAPTPHHHKIILNFASSTLDEITAQ